MKLLPTADLAANDYNPNRMSPGHFEALKRTIAKDGFVGAILANRIGDQYEVVDGEHRLRAARELNLPAVPCLVIQVTRKEAQALTIKLNQIHGDWQPDLLAELIGQISDPLEDLGFSEREIESLLKGDEESLQQLQEDLRRQASSLRPLCDERYIGFNLTSHRQSLLERALRIAEQEHDDLNNPRASSLEIVLLAYLSRKEADSQLIT